LKRAQRELELGAISQLEIYQPQAQYANAEILVSQAKFALQQSEDALRRQIAADLDPKLRPPSVPVPAEAVPALADLLLAALGRVPETQGGGDEQQGNR